MKTFELTGALLEYWTARARGVPAAELALETPPRAVEQLCARRWKTPAGLTRIETLVCSIDWAAGGPLVDRFGPQLFPSTQGGWWASVGKRSRWVPGDTALQALCRAIVFDHFGDEVPEVPGC